MDPGRPLDGDDVVDRHILPLVERLMGDPEKPGQLDLAAGALDGLLKTCFHAPEYRACSVALQPDRCSVILQEWLLECRQSSAMHRVVLTRR